MWIKTDDLQYIRKTEEGIYEVVEARYAEDKYLLCKGPVVLTDWMDKNTHLVGIENYTPDCREVILSY